MSTAGAGSRPCDAGSSGPGRWRSRGPWLAGLLLVVLNLAAFAPVLDNGFVNFDDGHYVTDSPITQEGLTWRGLRWALTDASFNWHPLTRLSHMLDCELYGLEPAGHHLTSLLLHIGAGLALFAALWRMTGELGRSFTVAALFGVHPAHVESVAWIAERKDVLSTFWWMVAVLAYAGFARCPTRWRMAAVTVAIGLGLSAKQMLVTAPFSLLLLDLWPLGRLRLDAGVPTFLGDLGARLREKAAPFALAAFGVWAALHGQSSNMMSLEALPLARRLGNAAVAYLGYVDMLLVPRNLVVFYPLREATPLATVLLSGAALAIVTATALALVRRAPYLAVGWGWYLGTLVPVIGLVQIGLQAMADRYTYVPATGLFVALTWGVGAVGNRTPHGRRLLAVACAVLLVVLVVATRTQVRHWRDSVTLFEHAVHTAPSDVAHLNLAEALRVRGDGSAAELHFLEAVSIAPDNGLAWAGLASARLEWGRPAEALEPARRASELRPADSRVRLTLASVLAELGRREAAIAELETIVALDPDELRARWGLCALQLEAGRHEAARPHCRAAAAADPGNPQLEQLLSRAETGAD